MAAQIEQILAHMRRTDAFAGVTRYKSSNITAEDLMAEAEVVGRFRTKGFSIDKGNRFVYENICKWIVGDDTMQCIDPRTMMPVKGDLKKGLYVSGRTGTGKTWALEILGYLATIHGFKFKSYGKDYVLAIHDDVRADELNAEFLKSGNLDLFEGKKLMVIQDLGTEPREVVYMGNRVGVLRQLLEDRGDQGGYLTVITSNLPMEKGNVTLAEVYGDRVASRLGSMCNYLVMGGGDRRVGDENR